MMSTNSWNEIRVDVIECATTEFYRNKKKQTVYKVLYRAVDCTNASGRGMNVYTPAEGGPLVFVREEAEFLEKFEERQD